MKSKLILITLLSLMTVSSALAQKSSGSPVSSAKPTTAQIIIKGTYEEVFDGVTGQGNAKGKLTIKFEAARWLTLGTNEVGNAEFSDLPDGPPPSVSGTVTYQGQVKGPASGADKYEATSNFAGALAGQDITITPPEYTDTGNNFKVRVFINPNIKGKCSLFAVRGNDTQITSGCKNGTFFFAPASPILIDDNDDPAKTAETANIMHFGIELDVEPPLEEPGNSGGAGDEGGYVWRGVTTGSQEAGFKILLDKTKDQPSDDKRSRTTRHLTFEATIVPAIPKS